MLLLLLLLLASLHHTSAAGLSFVLGPSDLVDAGAVCLLGSRAGPWPIMPDGPLVYDLLAAMYPEFEKENADIARDTEKRIAKEELLLLTAGSSQESDDGGELPQTPPPLPLPLLVAITSPRHDDILLFDEVNCELGIVWADARQSHATTTTKDGGTGTSHKVDYKDAEGLLACVGIFYGKGEVQPSSSSSPSSSFDAAASSSSSSSSAFPPTASPPPPSPFVGGCSCVPLDPLDPVFAIRTPSGISESDITVYLDILNATVSAADADTTTTTTTTEAGAARAPSSSYTYNRVGHTRRVFQKFKYGRSESPHLTPTALFSASAVPPPPTIPPSSKPSAFFTLLYGDDYLPGLLGLAASILSTHSKFGLHVMIPRDESSASGLSVSSSTLEAISSVGCVTVVPVPSSLGFGTSLAIGTHVPYLGVGQWLKLHMFAMTDFERIVYLDSDAMLTANVDELFLPGVIDRFASVGDYFAGSVFVVVPDKKVHERLMGLLQDGSRTNRFCYGEQDFLNFAFREVPGVSPSLQPRLVLSQRHYHCLAEDFDDEDENDSSAALPRTATCKIVEFASCSGAHGMLRWKPWMQDESMPPKICKKRPKQMFKMLVRFWRHTLGEQFRLGTSEKTE